MEREPRMLLSREYNSKKISKKFNHYVDVSKQFKSTEDLLPPLGESLSRGKSPLVTATAVAQSRLSSHHTPYYAQYKSGDV